MKSCKRIFAAATLAACSAFFLRGDLEPWVQHVPAGPAMGALFRSVPMPGGAVSILRPPSEARPALTSLISGSPRDATLYRLRAQEAEVALDFTAAEADWKSYVRNAPDSYGAPIELADFYHRRIRNRDELSALMAAAAVPDDPLQQPSAQKAWHAFERMASLTGAGEPIFRAWVARYPNEPAARSKLIACLSANQQFADAENEIAGYSRDFNDDFEPVRMRAELEIERGSPVAALAVYDRAFQPLWPEQMRASYFKLLEEQGQLREFAGRARAALASNPTDLDATARLFHYFKSQNNIPAARRVLLEYRIAKEAARAPAWTPGELQALAQLFEWLPDVNEAARLYYALYSVPPAGGAQVEQALYGLANLLLTAPDQPIQFGSGDLSFYKDIATVDPSPGFLYGILSLLLSSTGSPWEYRSQNEKSAAYFHRAAASQLVDLIERRFPKSSYRDPLRAKLISAYGMYGDDAAVIRAGREYMATFPNGGERVSVAMQVSDALARANRTEEEFALYDQLLRELAAKASGVPIGSAAQTRSGEYVQVLDKYLSRLAALKRPLDALRVYRNEIDRNPSDPGLYDRLGGFVEQNRMSREVEDVYTKAIAKFADRSWYHKLARWYLRTQQRNALEKISRDVIAVFSGTELERYFAEIVRQSDPDAALYLQLYLYAHERFAEDLTFVHNLLNAYVRSETADPAAADRLLRQYWFYDRGLRATFFERLSQQDRLIPELRAIRNANPGLVNGQYAQALAANPASVQFASEAEAWLSHFESAAPALRSLATAYPGRKEFAFKASALYRSLAAYDPRDTAIATTLAGYEQKADPRDPNILARIGDIFADRELITRARTFWERMPAAQPDEPEVYLDTATVYWDYYRYNDALRWINTARKKFDDTALFAYQAGAIYEGKRDDRSAVREYTAGALNGETNAEDRLLRLSNRPGTGNLVNRATAAAMISDPSWQAASLRIRVLEAQQRRQDIETLLQARVNTETLAADLTELQETARRLGFDAIEARASERLAAITNDPVDKMRRTLANARLLESRKDLAGAGRVVDALYQSHPLILGALRGAVDFHVRNQQPEQAIGILLDASKSARSDLAARFTLESARIAASAAQFDRARSLLTGLLAAEPFQAEYLAAMADTYLQAKDDRGFRDYQLAILENLKGSPLAQAERIERVAAIRRSLIPVLDRLNESAGAVDQYLEVLNSYPEDETLTKEAAAYAVAHGQATRMGDFYRKAIAAAPLDYRWPIVLGRVETVAEDFPSAIAEYERAIKDRPDRADVFEAKGRLEERLMRFDDAIKTYSRLYELAYRDPQWLIKVAELHARSGRNSEAVRSLKTAVLGARTETADADFEIAEQLDSWNILDDAVTFADRGAKLAGPDLFTQFNNALTYARIMARGRRMEGVVSRLGANPGIDAQVAEAAGKIIHDTYTPEEKTRLERMLTTRDAALLPLVRAAGLAELESRWRRDLMAAQSQQIDERLVTLQSQRGLYAELGRQLEQYAAANPGKAVEGPALIQATQAFLAEGDIESAMRVLGNAFARGDLSGDLLERYLSLLASQQPDQLLAIARGNGPAAIRNQAVQAALSADRSELAYSAVRARGTALPPVWTSAYTALTGQYLDDRSPQIDAAFQTALDTGTIGERLKTPLKPDAVIAGSVWFYYGARYGDYLATGGNGAADAWLPASLEAEPANPDAYIRLGDFCANAGQGAKAISLYERALELDQDRGDAHDHMAGVLWAEGRRPEAIARWKSALATFVRVQSRGIKVPEPFWNRVAQTFWSIGEHKALGDLQSDIASLLGDYYQRNNIYRFYELIEPAARASLASGQGIGWLIELGRTTGNPDAILPTLSRTPGLTGAVRIELQRAQIATFAKNVQDSFGDSRDYVAGQYNSARLQLVAMLLDAGNVNDAAKEWDQIAPVPSRLENRLRDALDIRLASKRGQLDSLLERYHDQPQTAPPVEELRNGALQLRRDGDENGARSVLEFLYDREIRSAHLEPINFLGLAEVKLQRNDAVTALALLNRMALVAEDGFETLGPAAQLLARYGHPTEAADLLRRRVRAVPWDSAAKLELARTLPQGSPERAPLLGAVITDPLAAYSVRAGAARLAARPDTRLAESELALLSSPVVASGAASKPYQVEARVEAANKTAGPEMKLRLWREALAIAPSDERVRVGALRAAIELRRDSLALALGQSHPQSPFTFIRRGRYPQIEAPAPAPDAANASIAESLAEAAERLDDLVLAQTHLRAAIALRSPNDRGPLVAKLDSLTAELARRANNIARQPAVKDVVEQDRVVRPRIARSLP